jgi:hypothetical protein
MIRFGSRGWRGGGVSNMGERYSLPQKHFGIAQDGLLWHWKGFARTGEALGLPQKHFGDAEDCWGS